MYVISCDFQKSFIFDKIVEIESHMRFAVNMQTPDCS